MGPENKIDLTGYTLYSDGEPLGKIRTLPEITLTADAPETAGMISKMESITMTFKTPKYWHCRSRKRFVKLMMSTGLSRNKANLVARIVREFNVTYGRSWRSTLLYRIGLL